MVKPSPGVHILNGHILHRENPGPENFRRLLKDLQRECRLLRIEEAVRMILTREIPAEPCVAFTFDDGFEEQYTAIAPVLEEFGINAAFFILPGFISGDETFREKLFREVFSIDGFLESPKAPMTWDQVHDLHKRGHVIGSHGMSHISLPGAGDDRIREEMAAGDLIEAVTGEPCTWFAYPFGKPGGIGEEALALAEQRYQVIFSQSNYRHYFSFGNRVINRRHFEPCWPEKHVRYFLSTKRK